MAEVCLAPRLTGVKTILRVADPETGATALYTTDPESAHGWGPRTVGLNRVCSVGFFGIPSRFSQVAAFELTCDQCPSSVAINFVLDPACHAGKQAHFVPEAEKALCQKDFSSQHVHTHRVAKRPFEIPAAAAAKTDIDVEGKRTALGEETKSSALVVEKKSWTSELPAPRSFGSRILSGMSRMSRLSRICRMCRMPDAVEPGNMVDPYRDKKLEVIGAQHEDGHWEGEDIMEIGGSLFWNNKVGFDVRVDDVEAS
jgi:hypothetical protein